MDAVSNYRYKLVLPFLSFLFSSSVNAYTLSFSTDNDAVIGSDRNYSSGLFLRLSHNENNIGYGIELASQLWTPSNIEEERPQLNERPYAGTVHLQFFFHQQEQTRAYKAGLALGRIGPHSGAEKAQKFIHDIIGSPDPLGWDYQIQNDNFYELNIEAQHLLLSHSIGELGLVTRAKIGNFRPDVALGFTYRYGDDLINTYGATSVMAGNTVDAAMLAKSKQGYFAFASTEISFRFSDLTIEGDQPESNPVLTIENLQYALALGGVWYKEQWGIASSLTLLSPSFDTSRYHHTYGNLTFFYRF